MAFVELTRPSPSDVFTEQAVWASCPAGSKARFEGRLRRRAVGVIRAPAGPRGKEAIAGPTRTVTAACWPEALCQRKDDAVYEHRRDRRRHRGVVWGTGCEGLPEETVSSYARRTAEAPFECEVTKEPGEVLEGRGLTGRLGNAMVRLGEEGICEG